MGFLAVLALLLGTASAVRSTFQLSGQTFAPTAAPPRLAVLNTGSLVLRHGSVKRYVAQCVCDARVLFLARNIARADS